MPETLDELFAAVSADVAARTSAPGAREAIAATRRRTAALAVAFVAAGVAGVLSITVHGGQPSHDRPAPAASTPPTEGLDVGDVPVWLDSAGLHRGDVVEQTAVRVRLLGGASGLTVVRTGALYIDVVGQQVWFHPWGGRPRVVGHGSRYGAVGDPEGDTAAWFEGSELVVYDTDRPGEVARVRTTPPADIGLGEHIKNWNAIMQVTSESVVWVTQGDRVLRLDIGSRQVTERRTGTQQDADGPRLMDVHDGTELLFAADPDGGELVVRAEGATASRFAGFEPRGRLSPDGRFVLAVTGDPHGTGFVEVATGERFTLPVESGAFYPWIGWSYGHTALVQVTDQGDEEPRLLSCDAERRRCEQLPSVSDEVLPPAT